MLPLERVLEAPQAHQPGTLREVDLRGLAFEVPEFPRVAGSVRAPTLPPAELGEHTLEVLRAAGVSPQDCEAWLASGAVRAAQAGSFAWAPVREGTAA